MCLISKKMYTNFLFFIIGLGLECLKNILKIVTPTILIEVAKENNPSMFDYREWIDTKTDFYQIQSQFPDT